MARILKSQRNFVYQVENFMDYCKLKGLSKKILSSYESTLKLFYKYLDEEFQVTRVEDVKISHVKDYVKLTKERGKYSYVYDDKTVVINNPSIRRDFGKAVSDVTINNYIRNLKVFFTWSVDDKSPMDKVEFLKAKRKPKAEITDSEFNLLIKSIDITKYFDYRDYIIIQLIMDTGMRLGETLSLTIEDIDVDRRSILIPTEITKGKKERYVFFSNTMAGIIRRWIQYKDRYVDNDVIIFSTLRGTKLSAPNFERNFRLYKERACIKKDITPHGLRNNFAKRCLMSGMDIYTLSRILGHRSVTVKEKAYLDLTVTDIRKNYQRFSPLENMRK